MREEGGEEGEGVCGLGGGELETWAGEGRECRWGVEEETVAGLNGVMTEEVVERVAGLGLLR